VSSYGTPVGKIVKGRFVPNNLIRGVEHLIVLGKKCTLTKQQFVDFQSNYTAVSWFDCAKKYIEQVSKAIFTEDWIDSMVHLIGVRSIVQEKEGSPLEGVMKSKGLVWSHDAKKDCDVLFYPWMEWSLYPPVEILKAGIPILIVGSESTIEDMKELWENDSEIPFLFMPVVDVFEWFVDVCYWKDFEAMTWVVLPHGTALIVDGVCLAGPSKNFPLKKSS
jgi:hypothetical protein